MLPNGMTVEHIDTREDERVARARAKSGSRLGDPQFATMPTRTSVGSLLSPQGYPHPDFPLHPPPPPGSHGMPLASPTGSVRSYTYGDQPWLANQARRSSSPQPQHKDEGGAQYALAPPASPSAGPRSSGLGFFGRSSSDLRSVHSPRSMSPGGQSLGVEERRGSMWSKFRQSASQSVLSFAPSGSMMDMHLGLSMDKHQARDDQLFPHDPYRGASDTQLGMGQVPAGPARAVSSQQLPTEQSVFPPVADEPGEDAVKGKKKKKGLSKFLSKVFGGDKKGSDRDRDRARDEQPQSGSFVYEHDPLRHQSAYQRDEADYPLAPPPPISALVNDPAYHQHSASNSSIDSFPAGPHTPPVGSAGGRRGSNPLLGGGEFGFAGAYPRPSAPADRQSVLTAGSYASQSSRGKQLQPGNRSTVLSTSRTTRSRQSIESLGEGAQRTTSPELYQHSPPTIIAATPARAGSGDVADDSAYDTTTEVLSNAQDPVRSRPTSSYSGQLSPDPSQQKVRKEKSLPFLPSPSAPLPPPEPSQLPSGGAGMYQLPAAHRSASGFVPQGQAKGRETPEGARSRAKSVYSLHAPSGRPSFSTQTSARSDWSEGAGAASSSGRKSKLGGKMKSFGWRKNKAEDSEGGVYREGGGGQTAVSVEALGAIERDSGGLVSVRY